MSVDHNSLTRLHHNTCAILGEYARLVTPYTPPLATSRLRGAFQCATLELRRMTSLVLIGTYIEQVDAALEKVMPISRSPRHMA